MRRPMALSPKPRVTSWRIDGTPSSAATSTSRFNRFTSARCSSLGVVFLEVDRRRAIKPLRVEDLLVRKHALGEEAAHLALGDLLGDLLRLARALGLLDRNLALLGHQLARHILAAHPQRVVKRDV